MAACEMDVTVVSKGREKNISGGYLYVFHKVSIVDSSLTFWHCEQCDKCRARIHTRLGQVVKRNQVAFPLPINNACKSSEIPDRLKATS